MKKTNLYVALLRGVNVGGKGLISMKALKESFERVGFKDVRTYINSGNIIFISDESDPRKLEQKIEGILAKEHKLENKVVVRSFGEMEKLIKSLPEDWTGGKEKRWNIIFLCHSIDSKEILKELKPKDVIEEVFYKPGTLLWSTSVEALTKTFMVKLSNFGFYQDMTIRNLNTAKKLYEIMKGYEVR